MPTSAPGKRWYEVASFLLVGLVLWLVVTLVCRTNWSSRDGFLGVVYLWAYAHFVPLGGVAEVLPRGLPSSLRGGLIFQTAGFALAGLALWGLSKGFGLLRRRAPLARALLIWGAAEALFVVIFAAAAALGLGAE